MTEPTSEMSPCPSVGSLEDNLTSDVERRDTGRGGGNEEGRGGKGGGGGNKGGRGKEGSEHVQRDHEGSHLHSHLSVTLPTCLGKESPQHSLPPRSNTEPQTDLEQLRRAGNRRGGGETHECPSVEPADNGSAKVKNALEIITEDATESPAALSPPSSIPSGDGGSRFPFKYTYSMEREDGQYAGSRLLFSVLQPGSPSLPRSTSVFSSFDLDSAYPSLPSLGEQSDQQCGVRCPAARKQFLRRVMKVVKESSKPRARKHKETEEDMGELLLDEPSGVSMDTLWNELQAYIHGRSPKEQEQFVHSNQERIEQVFHQIFQCTYLQWNTLTSQEEKMKEEEEEEEKDENEEKEEKEGEGEEGDVPANKMRPEQFLDSQQLLAMDKVRRLLHELEEVEKLYPNSRKMGEAHPRYRSPRFCQKVDALTLWLKVMDGLCKTLSSMSSWLGVPVILPELCREYSQSLSSGVMASSSTESQGRGGEGGREEGKLPAVSSSPQESFELSCRNASQEKRLRGAYCQFVDRSLKKRSVASLMSSVQEFIKPIQELATTALHPGQGPELDEPIEESVKNCLLPDRNFLRWLSHEHASSRARNWSQEFELIHLPHFGRQYVQLVHIPLDVMHECLKLQLELRLPNELHVSLVTMDELVGDCRETLQEAIKVREHYQKCMEVITCGDQNMTEQVDSDLKCFEDDFSEVLLHYLQTWVQVSSGCVLEEEWKCIKEMCAHLPSGEAEAGRRFCDMTAHLLETAGDFLKNRMDEICTHLHDERGSPEHKIGKPAQLVETRSDMESRPEQKYQFLQRCLECKIKAFDTSTYCQKFKKVFTEVRERALKAIGFAKILTKDLEIAADFSVQVSDSELLSALEASGHTLVLLDSHRENLIFVPEHSKRDIQKLLTVIFGASDQQPPPNTPSLPSTTPVESKHLYLLLVARDHSECERLWTGRTVRMKASAETIIAMSEIQVKDLTMIVTSSTHLSSSRTSFLNAVGKAVQLTNEQTSSHENVAQRIHVLKLAACRLATQLMEATCEVRGHLQMKDISHTKKSYREAMNTCFNLGFDYVREVFHLVRDEMAYSELGRGILDYAQEWMRFALEKCNQETGTPRWASKGLSFLSLAVTPGQVATMSHQEFEDLKKLMTESIRHVTGDVRQTQLAGRKCERVSDRSAGSRLNRFKEEVTRTDMERDRKLLKRKTIGQTLPATAQTSYNRQISLKWQKGSEIQGDGRFGKVYECHNVETGERMVVKEITIQERDCYQVQKAVLDRSDPLKKLDHPNILKFFGVECHETELYIFMEYCGDGTLQELAVQGLREEMVRHYTRDLLKAVETLHNQDIVHRNIKGSNIFLSSNGSIKLGDFGMAMELKGNLSKKTLWERDADISFLSPEAVFRQEFGRPMDIWSVGCVVVEMATGKEPWSGSSRDDIIVKLSSRECPMVQSRLLGKEGQDFLQTHCFDYDPSTRATAGQLLKHTFVKDYVIDINDLTFGDCLGGGSFGTVYSGKWKSRDIEVAIKKVQGEPSESDVKILSSLSPHPNIIAFYGYARTRQYTNIVTELAKNGSLYDRLHSQQQEGKDKERLAVKSTGNRRQSKEVECIGEMVQQEPKDKEKQVKKPPQENFKCLVWAKEIAQGMVYLHRLEIIHRDLKSANVLLTEDDTAKLCDFGTARYFPSRNQEEGQGTYRWMAPEVIDGGSADKHSDVYSFSMVMWELMAHKIPFHHIEDERDAALVALEKHRPQLDDHWPKYIRVLIQKCWNHHPHHRPSFDDIVTALWHKSCMK